MHTTIFEKESFFKPDGLTFLLRPSAWGGVWMFFALGGYLSGKNYAFGRYDLTASGVLRYYAQRARKVLLPVFCFIFLCVIIAYPSFIPEHPDFLVKILTFRYNGNPGADGIGACWYVFTLFWLWLLTSLVAFVLLRMLDQRERTILFFAIALFGYAFRQIALTLNWNWQTRIYMPPYANFDLYFGGMIIGVLIHDVSENARLTVPQTSAKHACAPQSIFWKTPFKALAGGIFAAVILTNCWIYNRSAFPSDFVAMGRPFHEFCHSLHVGLYPTLYLLSLSFYFIAFDAKGSATGATPSLQEIRRNPLRLIDAFSAISFEFYLFHSLILNRISPFFNVSSPLTNHLLLLLCAGVLTILFSIGFHRIFLSRRQSGDSQN